MVHAKAQHEQTPEPAVGQVEVGGGAAVDDGGVLQIAPVQDLKFVAPAAAAAPLHHRIIVRFKTGRDHSQEAELFSEQLFKLHGGILFAARKLANPYSRKTVNS
jgi:hypothetical protein